MKKFYLVLIVIIWSFVGYGQGFSVDDLIGLTNYTSAKFESYVLKKGFRSQAFGDRSTDSIAYTYYDKKAKAEYPEKYILKHEKENVATVFFQTTSFDEFTRLSEQLKGEGFTFKPADERNAAALYQKRNITIKQVTKTIGDRTTYTFSIEKKDLPKAKDIVYAEDLLQITSHEYLVSVFGEANVKKDVFYFSDDELNKCSVLYPNTNLQVIFIWKDEVNNSDISFLLVGGHLRAQSSLTYHKQIEQNAWQSSQGIYSGMTLKELHKLNGNNISIYGWQTDQPGVVTNKNTGNIDFKKIGLFLNCLDCNEDKYYSGNDILNSTDLLSEGRRVYVSTIVILPEKK